MKNISARKVLKDILGTVLILIPAFILEYFLKGNDLACKIIFAVSSITLALSALIGIISVIVFSPRREASKKLSIEKDRRVIWDYTEKCDANIDREMKKIRRIVIFEKVYFFFDCLIIMLAIASSILVMNVTMMVIFCFIAFSLVCFNNIGIDDSAEPGIRINAEEYPAVDEIMKESVEKYLPEATYGKDICAFAVHGPEVSTARWNGRYAVCIGVTALGLLSREQLKMAILHELCHIRSGDADFSADVMGLYMRYSSPSSVFTIGALFEGFPMFVIRNRIPKFMTASSRALELRIDKFVATITSYEEKRAYIGAVATMRMLEFCLADAEHSGNIFESPEPPGDFETRTESGFLRKLEEKESFWRELIEKELTARNAPYPTFAVRRAALGIERDDYDVAPDNDDYLYGVDRDELRRLSDVIIHDGMKLTYEEERKTNYLGPLDNFKKYSAKLENGDSLELGERIDYAFSLECLGKYGEAREMYDEILAEYPNDPATLFRRGLMYLNDFDERGVDMILRAMDGNSNYIKSGTQVTCDFCVKMGLEEKLEICRKRSAERLEYMYNSYYHATRIEKKDTYIPVGLPEDIRQDIIRVIISEFGEDLETVYMVDKEHDGIRATLIFVKPRDGYDEEHWNAAYHNVFLNLDVRDEHFVLDSYNGEPKYIQKIAKLEGTLIYKRKK